LAVPPRSRSALRFFLLVFALSVPFAVLGSLTDRQLYPGIPISALGFVCPVAAAAILSWRSGGANAALALLRRALDYQRIRPRRWLPVIVLLMPAITTVTYALARAGGATLRNPRIPVPGMALLFLVFLVAALGEELGWTGYAIDPLQERLGVLAAALLLGAVWAVWHIVAMVQAGQSAAWIAWGCLDMVATRVLMVWLYDRAGKSVFAIALFHAMANLSTKTLFPGGSYQGERIMSLLLAATALVVALTWRSRTGGRTSSRVVATTSCERLDGVLSGPGGLRPRVSRRWDGPCGCPDRSGGGLATYPGAVVRADPAPDADGHRRPIGGCAR
jgi:membrane protease YdiL (CAAX protease family)